MSIIGSIVGIRLDLAEVFALHAAGKTTVVRETRALDEVNAQHLPTDDVVSKILYFATRAIGHTTGSGPDIVPC